jgi:hypothetical protein
MLEKGRESLCDVQADADARKRLAVRAYQLREAVVHSRSDLRHHRTVARRQRVLLASAAHKQECHAIDAEEVRQECWDALAAAESKNVRCLPHMSSLPHESVLHQCLQHRHMCNNE